MPKPRTRVRSNRFVKYTFPVVRAAIDKVGPPREIGRVAPHHRGPLLVTLAMEIATDCARDIWTSSAAGSAGGRLPTVGLQPDMFEGSVVRCGGAGQLLLTDNARWWTKFADESEASFRDLAAGTGRLRFLLRLPDAVTAAERLFNVKKTLTYDGAWVEIVKRPTVYFDFPAPRVTPVSERLIGKRRSLLVQEDKQQQEWIHKHFGGPHPCASTYWDIAFKHAGAFLLFPAARAHNELFFCLARGESGWTAKTSNDYPQADWNDWLKKARATGPHYWPIP